MEAVFQSMLRTVKLAGVLLTALVAVQFMCRDGRALAAADDDHAPFRVVMVRSSNLLSPAAIAQDQQMREALERRTARSIQFFVEILDTIDFNGAAAEKEFLSLFQKKYRDQHIDLLLAVGRDALTFTQRYRAQLLPKVPVLFYNVAVDNVQQNSLPARATGTFVRFDVAGTLNLARRLQAHARQLVVIGGTSAYDKNWLRRAREALASYAGKVKVSYLTNLSLPEIIESVKKLEPDTIVVFLSMARDGAGRTYPPRTVIRQVVEASRAPVYGVMDINLGEGIVGGVMPSFASHGKMAGELAARLLAGEMPNAIAPPIATAKPTVDWRQLERWGLNEKDLPPDTVVLYRSATLWQEYRWQILGLAAVLVIESLLVAALLIQRRRRKRAESAFDKQYLELAHANVSLTMSEAKNRAILNALPDLMFIQTTNGVYVDYHCKDSGGLFLPAEKFIGKNMRDVFPAHLADEFSQCFKRAAESGDPVIHEYTLPMGDQSRHFEARIIRYNDDRILTMVRDITERKNAEQLLRESQNSLKTIMDHSPAVVFLKDRDGRYLYVNPRFEAIAALPAKEIVGKTDFELFSNEQAAVFHVNDLMVLDSGAPAQFEEVAVHEDGPHTSVVYKFPLFDADGKIYATGGIATDITERKRVEEALQESEARFRYMADYVPTIIWINDARGRCTYVNRQWTEFTGTALEQQLGFGWLDSVHPDDREAIKKSVQAATQNHAPFSFDYRVRRHDGKYRSVIDTGSPRFSPSGEFLGYIGAVIDITERKQIEEALRESEERYRNVVETQTEMICRNLPDTTLTFVNDAYCRYFGKPRGELIGTKFLELIPPRARSAVFESIEMFCKYPKTHTGDHEHQVTRPDGSIGWQRWTNHLLMDADGRVVEMQAVGRDITERRRAEEELKEALSEIKRLKERLEAENVYLRSEVSGAHRYGEMIGESAGMKKVLEQVRQVAPTDMTVLVLGETGTGKELVARLVHEKSGRRERPLVKVNCSTLPAELIESELFGHERGAFTGAVGRQVGRFELADGGTIFLDEVGELPLRLQAKLLRVLQEGEFERLGSGKTIKVDVRVIAATNRNLNEAAQRGRFRSDLYYRLNVYPIEIPPLRERQGDIGLLAEVFLQESGRRLGKRFGKIRKETIEELGEYGWPGNVRELENVIGRAAVISTAPILQLPDGWNKAEVANKQLSNGSRSVLAASNREAPNPDPALTLRQFERTRILEVLHQTNWRIEGPKGAALILGLHPNTLRSRLNKLGITKTPKPRNAVAETTK